MNEPHILETANRLPIITWMGNKYALMPSWVLAQMVFHPSPLKLKCHRYSPLLFVQAWRKAEQEYGLNLNYSSFKKINSDQYDKIIRSSSQL